MTTIQPSVVRAIQVNSSPHHPFKRNRWLRLTVSAIAALLTACNQNVVPIGPAPLNSRYTEGQASLSGNGRYLAFVSSRNGQQNILMYDLQTQQFVPLPYLNRGDAIADSPSISYNGRYMVYIASDQGRAELQLYDRVTQRSQILTMGYRGWVRSPSISPDGRYIVFESGYRGQWDIEMVDRGPTIELDLPQGARIGAPSPAPNP